MDRHGQGLPVDHLKRSLRVSTHLRATPVAEDTLALGASRLGGLPDLPASLEWPRWEGYYEPDRILGDTESAAMREIIEKLGGMVPVGENAVIHQGCRPAALSLLAQVNLAEVPDGTGLLPENGWLYFFYDAEQQPWGHDPREHLGARVLYFDGNTSDLRRAARPPGAHVFAAASVTATLEPTLPRWADQVGLALGEPESDVYWDLAEKHLGGPEPHHRLLGWPKQVQGDMALQCQLVTHAIDCSPAGYRSAEAQRLKAGAADWVLLLQLDTDEESPGWMWGDNGCLYFWIRKQDLAERRFQHARTILQCY